MRAWPVPGGATDEITRTEPPGEIRAVPVRHYGRWIAAAVIAILVASLARSVATNPRFEWGVVGDFLFSSRILQGLRGDARAHRARDGGRDRARRRAGPDADVAERRRERRELDLHLAPSRNAGARPDPVLVLHRRRVSIHRPRHSVRPLVHPPGRELGDHHVRRRNPGAGAERGRLHVGDRARGDHLGRRGPDRRSARPRDDAPADDAPHRPSTGDAGDHPADGQRDDLDAQNHVARRVHRPGRPPLHGAADLRDELQDDPAPDHGEHLVPRGDLDPVHRPVLPRAILRPRKHTRNGAHPLPADTNRLLATPRGGRAPTQEPPRLPEDHR